MIELLYITLSLSLYIYIYDNITVIIETLEDEWIKRFQALALNGFNMMLNHLQNTAFK